MKERGEGWVINMNSTNGLHPSAGTPACARSLLWPLVPRVVI